MKKSFLLCITTIFLVLTLSFSVDAFSLGDIDGDDGISAADARLALRASVGLEILTEEQIKSADVDGTPGITAADARLILRVSVGLEVLQDTSCEHKYGVFAIEKEATCLTTGLAIMKCSNCGDTYNETIPISDHMWTEATCSAPKTCNFCGLTTGTKLEHEMKNYDCINCDFVDVEKKQNDYNSYKAIINNEIAEIKSEGPLYYGSSTEFSTEVSSINTEISRISRRLSVLSADNSSSARAEKARLNAQLEELEAELDELYAARSRKNQIDALNNELESYYNSLFG